MRTPVVLVTGVDVDAMSNTMVGLLWDLESAVAVRHTIDPHAQVLTRVVSDMTGELERERIPLEHACVTCAIRADVLPTLERLAGAGRWRSVVACLPVAAEAEQVDRALVADPRLARQVRISSVVTALAGEHLVEDLLGDHLLEERGRHTGPDDRRGHGEVTCAMVEYADAVAVGEAPDPVGLDLVRSLVRPDALVFEGYEQLSGSLLTGARHDHRRAADWVSPLLPVAVPRLRSTRVWRLELSADRPFHPGRLLDGIELLGSGPYRSRGSFWLPTRPGVAQLWEGAGGQLSIGSAPPFGRRPAATRLLITGTGAPPEDLIRAFDSLLATGAELDGDPGRWVVAEDGFEPWLGPIREAA